ncbi:MAG: hypothetical protein ACOYKE_15675 [Ferruginibacter sp.]
MKYLLIALLISSQCGAQSSLLNTGNKLIYKVDQSGYVYHFALKPKSTKPNFTFSWQMDNEENNSGIVTVSSAALTSSLKMHNYFQRGKTTLANATSVLLSKAAYQSILKNKKVSLADGSTKYTFENADETDVTYYQGEQEQSVKAIYLSDAAGNSITVLKDEKYPLILRMNIGWSITLETVLPPVKEAVDFSAYIGKPISAPGIVYNLLDRSSTKTTEEYGDSTNGTREVFNEYFSAIEGLWLKVYNDTISDVIYYPQALTHSGRTYYGGDLKLTQLSKVNFIRTEAAKMVKIPFIESTGYDAELYKNPNSTIMEIYYHAPKKIKDGFEFGIIPLKMPKSKQVVGFISFHQ